MQLSLDLNIKNEIPEILLSNKKPLNLDFLPDNCVIVDIETTGFSPQNDSIIEICALKMVNNEIVIMHLHSDNVVIRVSIVPEEINVDGGTLSIEYKSFCLNIDNIDYIEHIKEEYDTYYVKSGDIKIYFDFV